MALTLDFKETIKDRVERDPAFREELLKEGIECLLTGDVDTGNILGVQRRIGKTEFQGSCFWCLF